MPDVDAVRRETAQELKVDEAELDYIEEVLAEVSEDVPEDAGAYSEVETVEGQLINSFDCRRPVYEGRWLYYYRNCDGPFGRLRRDRIVSIFRTGYCGWPVRRWKVRWR